VKESFTIVILSFERQETLLDRLINNYVNLRRLNKIIIIWNSFHHKKRPSDVFKAKLKFYLESKFIEIITTGVNSLNNRFIPFNLIQTDAVLNLDDDIELTREEITFAFDVWRNNRDRIVGFPARHHSWNVSSNSYVYKTALSCEYSLILTGAAFYHKWYNYAYTHLMDARIRQKVDELSNCEDVAFNLMVSHLIRKGPVKVTSKIELTTDPNNALSKRNDHFAIRSQCLQLFSEIYGYNPLLYSQFRADSFYYNNYRKQNNENNQNNQNNGNLLPSTFQKCYENV
jgi:alpha-1,4-N-acetylglucosaminyltransferase EXTL3